MGLARRRLYKAERRPARIKGELRNQNAPIALLDANAKEVAMALYALCDLSGIVIGRAAGYDQLRDEYTVTGTSKLTGKAQDLTVKGAEVADAIVVARVLNGGKLVGSSLR
jgi:hypothetical protein